MCKYCDRPEPTPRTVEILQLIADGYSQGQIARKLGIHKSTVKRHLTDVRQRWGLPDTTVVVAQALFAGLIK